MARNIEVYTFDELDEQTQQAVLNKYRYDVAEAECDFVNDDFIGTIKKMCEQLGLRTGREYTDLELEYADWYYDEYCVGYETDEDGDEVEVDKDDCYENVVAFLNKKKNNFKYKDTWYFTGCYTDDAACRYIDEVLNGTEKPSCIDDFLSDLGSVIHRQWEDECDACSDDDVVQETIMANDWEFTAEGKRI